ncbi:MAG: LamB/YcsF family protein [Sphingobacteriales bacterium]|nr:LamB/YcsF family protein [Sphingobacteriales bacterium]
MSEYTDINCDMGEGLGNEAALMPFISSASIACGYHAGDTNSMLRTLELCKQYGVAAGAHPSFLDRANFGRLEKQLPVTDLYELLIQQMLIMQEVADAAEVKPAHVKPHGALYNLSAKDPLTAQVIAKAVKDFDSGLFLVGRSGSCSLEQAGEQGLSTISEVFADRTYQDDGSLTPRSQEGALITDPVFASMQVMQMITEGTVTTLTGKKIPLVAETVCIHGDNPRAVEIAKTIFTTLKQNGIGLRSFDS